MSSDSNDDDFHQRNGRDYHRDDSAGKNPASSKREKNSAHDREDASPNKVGYKLPPEDSRVRKGQVLNPKGRPKRSKNKPKEIPNTDLRTIVLNEAHRQVQVNDASGPVTVTVLQAVLRAQALSAAKGNARAQRDFIAAACAAAREEASERAETLVAIGEYMLEYERRYRARGVKPPSYFLDPDGFIIGPNGFLGFRDAATKDDTARWQKLRAEWQKDLEVLNEQYKSAKSRQRAPLQKDIAVVERCLDVVNNALAGSRNAMWILDQLPVPEDES